MAGIFFRRVFGQYRYYIVVLLGAVAGALMANLVIDDITDKIGMFNDDEENYLPLYIGESYSMLLRCSNHLYELFHNDPSYFGLTKEDLKDDELQLIVDIYEKISLEDNISNSDRDILLHEKEIVAIKKLMPLSQNQTNDNLNRNRSAIVKEAIKKLKSCNK